MPGIGSLRSLVVRSRPVGRCLGHRSPFAQLGDTGRARSVGALASSFRVVGPGVRGPRGALDEAVRRVDQQGWGAPRRGRAQRGQSVRAARNRTWIADVAHTRHFYSHVKPRSFRGARLSHMGLSKPQLLSHVLQSRRVTSNCPKYSIVIPL